MRQFTVKTLRDALERFEAESGDMPIVIEGGGYPESNYKLTVDHLSFEGDRLVISMGYRDDEEPESAEFKKAQRLARLKRF